MAERRRPEAEATLERRLRALGQRIDYPPTPDLAAAVRVELLAGRSPRARRWPFWSRLQPAWRLALAAAVAALLLAAAVLALSPTARVTVADRLGLRGLVITSGTPVPTPPGTPVGETLRLGRPVTLAEARARVAFPILVPALPDLGPPDQVYLDERLPGGEVALVWRPRPGFPAGTQPDVGLLLTEWRGGLGSAMLAKKLIEPNTQVEEVTVDGERGYWISGQPHQFLYEDPSGRVVPETIRLAGNTLVWERGTLLLRLEASVSKDQALRVADSMQPG